VLFGIRRSTSNPAPRADANLVVEVDLIEPLGADTLVYGRLGGNSGARGRRAPALVGGCAHRKAAVALPERARTLLRRGKAGPYRLMLKTTAVHERTAALCASHACAAGPDTSWRAPTSFSHEREYHVIRSAAALFDVSPLTSTWCAAAMQARLLDLVVTRNVLKAEVGQVLYTPWCDHAGKVIGRRHRRPPGRPGVPYDVGEPNLRWLQDNATGLDVQISMYRQHRGAFAPGAGGVVHPAVARRAGA